MLDDVFPARENGKIAPIDLELPSKGKPPHLPYLSSG